MGLGDHEGDAEQHQRRAGVADRQQGERVERDEQADGADQPGRDRARVEEFEDQPVDADEHEDEGDVRIGDEAEKLRAPAGRHGHDVETGGRELLRFAGDIDRAPIDLAQEIGDVVGDDIDDVKRERLGGGHACRRAHGVGGPIGVAAVEGGEAADIGDCVVDELARFGVRRFSGFFRFIRFLLLPRRIGRRHRMAGELDRRGGADIGARRHRRDRARIGDIGAGARRARAVRRDIGRDRHRRGEDRADDLPHRGVETARRIHAQNDDADFVRARGAKLAPDVVGERRADDAVDLEHERALAGRRRAATRGRQGEHRQRRHQERQPAQPPHRRRSMRYCKVLQSLRNPFIPIGGPEP